MFTFKRLQPVVLFIVYYVNNTLIGDYECITPIPSSIGKHRNSVKAYSEFLIGEYY